MEELIVSIVTSVLIGGYVAANGHVDDGFGRCRTTTSDPKLHQSCWRETFFHDAFRVVVWPFPVLLVVPCEDVENWLTDG
jgi:hypothetical protein